MNYQQVVATRHADIDLGLSPQVQERRILRSCFFMALCAILMFVLFPSLRAQDVFTVEHLPRIGGSYTRSIAAPLVLDPQPGGLDQNWDFSSLQSLPGRRDTVRFVDAKTLSGPIPFKANVAVLSSDRGSRVFYNTLKPSLSYQGEDDKTKQVLMGSDPFDIDPIPVKYNSSITSSYGSTISFPLTPSRTIRRHSTVEFTPDGTGNLMLPPGIKAVATIRVHWTEDHLDTVLLNNKPSYTARTTTDRYVWYDLTSAAEYLSITQGNVRFAKIAQTPPADSQIVDIRFIGSNDVVSEVREIENGGMQVYPMPASSVLRVSGISSNAQIVEATLFSLSGAELRSAKRNPDSNQPLELNVEGLAAQPALLELRIDGRRYTQRVLVGL